MSEAAPILSDAFQGAKKGFLQPTSLVNSVVGQFNAVKGAVTGVMGGIAQHSPSPHLQTPTTTAPDPTLATTTAIQSQLSKEQNARSSATLQTAPSGLTDEPTITSSLLTGV